MKNGKKGLISIFEKVNGVKIGDKSFLKEAEKSAYLNRINEGFSATGTYVKLAEHFSNHNKLTGKLNEDREFLREFSLLLEDEEFNPFDHLQKKDLIDEREDCILSISNGNNKINHPYFSLPAGYTCPFANVCKSFVNRDRSEFKSSGMKIMDTGDVRCYAASAELAYPSVQNSRWRNFDLLQKFKGDVNGMAELIENSINYFDKKFTLFRIHESGDFYSQEYFDAWLSVIRKNPSIKFYAYTKALPYWVARLGQIPANFKLTASKGGKFDNLIDEYGLKYAQIVYTPEEAKELGLRIDIDDSLAYNSDDSFALLLHGVQPKEKGTNVQAIKNQKTLKQYKKKSI